MNCLNLENQEDKRKVMDIEHKGPFAVFGINLQNYRKKINNNS